VNSSAIPRPLLRIALGGLALVAMALPATATAATKSVAKEGTVASLGKTVLTNNAGRTLYSLSVETHGHFICTGSCLATWKPLVVKAGTKPTGPAKLGTVKRPDGRTQVTYKGRPLYAFMGDTKPGEANGEGIKDVGTWHAATLASSSAAPESPPGQVPSPPANPSPSPSPTPTPTPPPYPYPSPY
jgi:predicted lipoprotein with Yx(FWY)xxD motif